MKGGQVLAPQALSIGMNTFDFMIGFGIMLYLLFFLLRDGRALAERIKEAIPLHSDQKAALFTRFADVFAPPSRAASSSPSSRARSAASRSGSSESTRRCYGPC